MLRSLHVENYVLIRQLDIDFHRGFSVITGETGSGKSILLGAIHLLLGGRAEGKIMRDGSRKCVIEAVFDIHGYGMNDLFGEADIEYDDQCIIRRELSDSGKSRLFVNDTPCPATTVRAIGNRLIDIHSQHANLLLKERAFQLSFVDTMAGNESLLDDCKAAYRAWSDANDQLRKATEAAQRHREESDYLHYQYDQLAEAQLTDGEQETLEDERQELEHAADIQLAMAQSHEALQSEGGALSSLNFADSQLRISSAWGIRYNELYERLHSTYIELKDIAAELERLGESVAANPQRLEQVSQRLDMIYTLQQKHQVNSIAGLLAKQREFEQTLSVIDNWEEEKLRLEKEVAKATARLDSIALQLHQRREKAIPDMERQLTSQLATLGIPHARFEIRLEATDRSMRGTDEAVILFSANRQITLQPIAQTASGGEMARIMLCIKAMIATSKQMPTILFDEIDTGISGETASRMAGILQQMSEKTQAICITHLPQIAAKGNTHYKVYKEDNGPTETHIVCLDEQGRQQEIAKMLSGERITTEAMQNAQALLKGN